MVSTHGDVIQKKIIVRVAADGQQFPIQSYLFAFATSSGTDDQGRDILSTILYGTRSSIAISVLAVLLAIGIGLGVSAIFWMPAILENSFVRADQWLAGDYDYHDDFVYLHQLFSPYWGFGTSGPGPNDGVGFQLGAVPLALAFLSLGALRGIRRPEARRWARAVLSIGRSGWRRCRPMNW